MEEIRSECESVQRVESGSWRAARDAEVEARKNEILKMISEFPALEGSAKQIAWASDIRQKTFDFLLKRYDMYVDYIDKAAVDFDETRETLYSNYAKTGSETMLKIANSYPTGKEQWEAAKEKAVVAHGTDVNKLNRTIDKLAAKFKVIKSAELIINHRMELSFESLRGRI